MENIIAQNVTRTTEYVQFYVPIDQLIAIALFAVFMTFMFFLSMYDFTRMRRVLDFYRLKYGFDRQVEEKDTKDTEKLDRREKYFKRRTFKD